MKNLFNLNDSVLAKYELEKFISKNKIRFNYKYHTHDSALKHMYIISRIESFLQNNDKSINVLDIGCGNGDALRIVNKVILPLENGKTAWFFHGDVFDITMQHSKWLAKLGAIGYDTLILINRVVNFISEKVFKKGKLSLSKKIKNSVKSAVKFINSFEHLKQTHFNIFSTYVIK